MDDIRWGIIGPGHIADKFAAGLAHVPGTRLYAVASTNFERAHNFSLRHHAPLAYGSYVEMITEKQIDIAYIATPHHLHHANTLMCLENGIPVLCEKPFAINFAQVNKMVEMARRKKLFLMEALWSAFIPAIHKVKEVIASNIIGGIRAIRADFCFPAPKNPLNRIFNKQLGGGALLDIGIYPVWLAFELLGYPDEVKAMATFGPSGIDENIGFVLSWKSGAIASLYASVMGPSMIDAVITCDKGMIIMANRFHSLCTVQLKTSEGNLQDITPVYVGNGMNYQAGEAVRCLRDGITESPVMSHHKSLELISLLDKIRQQCGIFYPEYEANEEV